MSSKLIGSITVEREFSTVDRLLELREEIRDGQKIWDDTNEVKLKVIFKDLEALDRSLIICA